MRINEYTANNEETVRQFVEMNSPIAETTFKEIMRLPYTLGIICSIAGDDEVDRYFQAVSLFSNACNIIRSSFHLACLRSYLEMAILLRSALETSATAYAVASSGDVSFKYTSTGINFKSTEAIKYAKKQIPIIGELWGTLSYAVHQNMPLYGPRCIIIDGIVTHRITISTNNREGNLTRDWLSLMQVNIISIVTLRLMELSMLIPLDEDGEKFRVPGNNIDYITPSKRLIDKYWNALLDQDTWPRDSTAH